MAGFFSKIFGGGKKEDLESVVEATLNGILEKGNFDLSYELNLSKKEEITEIKIEFSGGDEALLKDFKGQLLDAIQLIIKRVTQHHFSDTQTNVIVDCGGYREPGSGQRVFATTTWPVARSGVLMIRSYTCLLGQQCDSILPHGLAAGDGLPAATPAAAS